MGNGVSEITTMESLALTLLRQRERSRLIASYGVGALSLVGLLSAVSRPLRSRLEVVLEIMPFFVPRTASVTLVFVSIALLMTARGLRRGQQLAYWSALALLVISVILHIINGIDVEEAVLATAGAVWLAGHRAAFPVRSTREAAVRALKTGALGALAILVVAFGLAALTAHNRPAIPTNHPNRVAVRLGVENLFPLQFGGEYSQAALIALVIGVIVATLWTLLSPHQSRPADADAHLFERERARLIVDAHGGGTLDYFALRDDKQWFFIDNSVVAYAVYGGVCLVSPDPIGPPAERTQTWAAFMAYAERCGWSVAVIGTGQDWIGTYEATGLRSVYLGDEAIIDCAPFNLDGHAMKGLRQAVNRVTREGMTATFQDPATLDAPLKARLSELATMSRQGEVERGFSMTLSRLFDPHDTGLLLSIAYDRAGIAQAFIQWIPARDLSGWSLDVMRRNTSDDLPNGVMDFLVVETIKHIAQSTGGGLGLNFAVLREVIETQPTRWFDRFRRDTIAKAAANTQLESLARFNAKYQPRWVPRYVILGSIDALAAQGVVMARAEGIVPVLDKFLPGTNS